MIQVRRLEEATLAVRGRIPGERRPFVVGSRVAESRRCRWSIEPIRLEPGWLKPEWLKPEWLKPGWSEPSAQAALLRALIPSSAELKMLNTSASFVITKMFSMFFETLHRPMRPPRLEKLV